MTVIACLGWGSLVWDPQELPLGGEWRTDGPSLPVEFARQSQDQRITLVLVESARPCAVLWAPLNVETAEDARTALGIRENIPSTYWQDYIAVSPSSGSVSHVFTSQVADWAVSRDVELVVWTALPPKFASQNGRVPTSKETIEYLSRLEGEALNRARQYVERAPAQIRTPHRERIETELGWVYAAT